MRNKGQAKDRIVIPRGVDLIKSNIERVNNALSYGSNSVKMSMPDWYVVSFCITNKTGYIIHGES